MRRPGRAQLELGAGFGRDFSGRENIFLNGALHGLVKEQIEERLDAIIAFSELGDFIDAPVATYSSGMFLRLGFSIAAHLDADVLLIDEVLAVGDEAFQRKCEARIAEQIAAARRSCSSRTTPALIERTCRRVIVLDGGNVVFDGPVGEGMPFYHRLLGVESASPSESRTVGDGFDVGELELRDASGRRAQVLRDGRAADRGGAARRPGRHLGGRARGGVA